MGKFIDLTGKRFGRLTVIERAENKGEKTMWKCVCDCGNIITTNGAMLKNGNTKSCGCYARECESKRKFIDLTGQKFGRLTVIKRVENKGRRTAYLCLCDCGSEKVITAEHLRGGKTVSCGCYQSQSSRERNLIDLSGQKFGKLTVIEQAGKLHKNNGISWLCRCDCNNIVTVLGAHLRRGNTTSCGCIQSTAEYNAIKYLNRYNINYECQKKFDDLVGIGGGKLSYDFFLPDYELLIECQGQQHFYSMGYIGGKKRFERQVEHDKRKREYALDHNYELFEIPYWEYNNIESVLEEKIGSLQL